MRRVGRCAVIDLREEEEIVKFALRGVASSRASLRDYRLPQSILRFSQNSQRARAKTALVVPVSNRDCRFPVFFFDRKTL